MSKPRVFIGSSKASLEVAQLVANHLELNGVADAVVWNEGVFNPSQGTLERLLAILIDFDFAVLVWAPDDNTATGNGVSQASPRDNVVFECGLFMGAIGRERVFVICDQSAELKIPSDLAGITLARYDGTRVREPNGQAAVRMACTAITREIERPRYPNIVGDWTSYYPATAELGHPAVVEVVEIKASRGGISIVTKDNPRGDHYIAYGRIHHETQIIGEWRSTTGAGTNSGLFVLTVNPKGTAMYGYCTASDETNGTVYATWGLAKNRVAASEGAAIQQLNWTRDILTAKTIGVPALREERLT